ncbi:MAG: polysaccharide pyruvyl transferase CsaB [Firmicutes bacterium]|nr:polysaccharide pyruvyl transferase CsaB [Bacillota bacterium]
MKQSAPKIVISGYYGFGNTGDEAILDSIVKTFKTLSPQCKIVVLSQNPAKTGRDFEVQAISRKNIPFILAELFTADLFISGGGGLIQDVTGFSTISYYLGLIWLARFVGVRTMIYAQGIGPIITEKGKKLGKKIISRVNCITVRDNESKQVLENLGINSSFIIVTADPVMALEPCPASRVEEILKKENIYSKNLPLLGVSVRPWKTEINHSSIIAGALKRFMENIPAQVLLIPFQRSQDYELCKNIESLLPSGSARTLEEVYKPDELLGLMSRLDLLAGMRLHSLIFSAINRTPAVGISYDPKVKNFLSIIGAPCISLEELSDERLLEVMLKLWTERDTWKVPAAYFIELKQKALENAKIAFDLITRK